MIKLKTNSNNIIYVDIEYLKFSDLKEDDLSLVNIVFGKHCFFIIILDSYNDFDENYEKYQKIYGSENVKLICGVTDLIEINNLIKGKK